MKAERLNGLLLAYPLRFLLFRITCRCLNGKCLQVKTHPFLQSKFQLLCCNQELFRPEFQSI